MKQTNANSAATLENAAHSGIARSRANTTARDATTARYPAKPAAPNMLPAFAVCRTSSLISILASSTLRNNVARSLLVLEMSSDNGCSGDGSRSDPFGTDRFDVAI